MHCAACEFVIEDALTGAAGVTATKADLATGTVTITGNFNDDPVALASALTARVATHGYRLSAETTSRNVAHREFIVAIPAAATFIIAFLVLQKLGLANLITASDVTYGTAFVIGLIASVSTCLAVVGGLILSVSANAAKQHGRWQSQALFHAGRLGGFFILGGAIGALGNVARLGLTGTAILSIAAAVVMLLLGINLLDLSPVTRRFQLRMPKVFARHATRVGTAQHRIAPLIAGTATFFLPCGFTQSMQVYALTTGSYLHGGLTMLAFALGTLPVLALLSFGSFEVAHTAWKGTFFKATGIVVIILALVNVWNGLATLGLIPPLSLL